MLSFSNSFDHTNADEQGGFFTIAIWLGWAVLYHIVFLVIVGAKDLQSWDCEIYTAPIALRVSSRSLRDVCPRRRARWYKCAKRCEKQSEKKTPTEECCFAKCAMNLVKLHLPPPLPLKPKKKKKKDLCVPDEEKKALSSCGLFIKPSEFATTVSEEHRSQEKTKDPSTVQSPLPPVLQPASPVPLIDLARMQYWQSVLQQVTRRGAKYRDCDGLYSLHWACSGGPPSDVVQVLLDTYPSAARKTDKEGSNALHFATHYSASAAVVHALLSKYPKAASLQDRYGRTPLLHAVEKCAGMDVLEQLVQVDPSVITLPCLPEGQRNAPTTRGIAQRTPLYMAWSAVLLDRNARESKRGRKWEKALFLLQSAHKHTRNVKYSFSSMTLSTFLGAAIELDLYLPTEVVPMAVTMHPEQLCERDEVSGRMPLLQAAAAPLVSRQRSDELISLLLQANPSVIKTRDRSGKSALQLALESGKPWSAGVQRLFQANPDAIYWVDNAGMSTALAAATVSTSIADSDVPSAEIDENPLGFLSPKYKEIMRRRRMEILKPSVGEHKITATEQVSTILDLLLADPSVITTSRK